MTDRNTTPANEWQALRRLLLCNKSQLAARLGITRQTLRMWEDATDRGETASDNARRAAAELLTATLRAANNADDLLHPRKATT
jgi:DNA-binding transcriptional regulator YiaG